MSSFLLPFADEDQYNLTNTYSNYSSIETFNETGPVDFSDLINDVDDAYTFVEQDTGTFITDNVQDYSMRSGLSIAGWQPKKDAQKEAAEWWVFDWEYSWQPEVSSAQFTVANYNTTVSPEKTYIWLTRVLTFLVVSLNYSTCHHPR